MKKSLRAILVLLLLSVQFVGAQPLEPAPSKAGFRLGVSAGMGILTAKKSRMGGQSIEDYASQCTEDITVKCPESLGYKDAKNFGYQCDIAPAMVFNNNAHALGLLFSYKYNKFDGKLNYSEIIYANNEPMKIYDYNTINIDWHTTFIGPQYTWMPVPHSEHSFFMDFAVGYTNVTEKYNGIKDSASDIGSQISLGSRIEAGKRHWLTLKLSFFTGVMGLCSKDDKKDISSLSFSIGFMFGK